MMPSLHAEMWHAMRFARAPELKPKLASLQLSPRMQYGLAWVDYYGLQRELYEPVIGSSYAALVVPIVEQGDTIDLAAIHLPTEHIGLRVGYGQGLGMDAVERARYGFDLKLYDRPLAWARDPANSCYLFNLSSLRVQLDGVATIACANLALADRVAALLPWSERKRAQVM